MQKLIILGEGLTLCAFFAGIYALLHLACAFSDQCSKTMGWM